MTKKLLIRTVASAIFLLLLVWLIVGRFGKVEKQVTASAPRSTTLPVSAFVARNMPLNDVVVASGTVLPDEMVDLAPEVSGRIVKIHFIEGQTIVKGDLLVTLNNADLQAQLLRNQHQLRLAEDRERRQRMLLDSEGISQQAYEQTLTELNSLKAEAALLQAQLDKTFIKAPFGGTIGLRMLSEGAFVTAGTKIVRLVRSAPVKIDFSIPERYASFVRKGTLVKFYIDGKTEAFEAEVAATEVMLDQRSRMLTVRAVFPNRKGEIKPGMFTRVEFSTSGLVEALQIPTSAVIPEMGNNKVFVFRNGKAQAATIEPGLRTTSMLQVLSGLAENDTVITSGLLQLRPGMPVELKTLDQP